MISQILAQAASTAVNKNIIDYYHDGGWVMHVLLVVAVMSLMLVFYLWQRVTKRSIIHSESYVREIKFFIRQRQYADLLAMCLHSKCATSAVMKAVFDFFRDNHRATYTDLQHIAESEASRQAEDLQRPVSWLADLGGIAPMLGLLGTLFGMIQSFGEIAGGNFTPGSQMKLSEGIAVALYTTVAGLLIAIPVLLAYAYFRAKANRNIADLDKITTELLTTLSANMPEFGPNSAAIEQDFFKRQTLEKKADLQL